ncbi:MAG: UbiA family prenyltransferase, partial [Gemmatimonadales bacterium]|nr:UbiA family prenyltransferase [Gemmatimonadales bacterium]
LWSYQAERFPLIAYAPMVVAFTASAAYYSRFARGEAGFIPGDRFVVGAFTALVFFAWLRILDEHKDAEIDRRYRPELPVPRGLVTRAELRRVGGALLALALALNLLVAPQLFGAIALVAAYAALMTKEFFVGEWLRARPIAYLLSHMAILPLIDFYTTGLDWLAEGVVPPPALGLFLALTYFNGVVVEVGRKIRVPEAEREGVDTYTKAWGLGTAPMVWLAVLALTAVIAGAALLAVGASRIELGILGALALGAAVPALRFLRAPRAGLSRQIEAASGVWTIAMYLLLGIGRAAAHALGAG